MKYYLKKVSATVWYVQESARKIGTIMPSKERPGQYVATINGEKAYGATPEALFYEATARLNRIKICGEDNVEKARETIAAHNAATVERANEFNALFAGSGLRMRVKANKVRI